MAPTELLPYFRWKARRRTFFALIGLFSTVMLIWTLGILLSYGVGKFHGYEMTHEFLWLFRHVTIYLALASIGVIFFLSKGVREKAWWILE